MLLVVNITKHVHFSKLRYRAKVKMTTNEFMITGKNSHLCPACGQAEMEIIQVLPPIRGSPFNIYQRPIPKDRIVKLNTSVA